MAILILYVKDGDDFYTLVNLYNKNVINYLMDFITKNNLFVLNRKWDKTKKGCDVNG